jgi:hypothetical protein
MSYDALKFNELKAELEKREIAPARTKDACIKLLKVLLLLLSVCIKILIRIMMRKLYGRQRKGREI